MKTGLHGSTVRTKWADAWKALSRVTDPWKALRKCELLDIIITAQRGHAPCSGSHSQCEAEQMLTPGSGPGPGSFLTQPLSWEAVRWHSTSAYHALAASPSPQFMSQVQSPNQQVCFSYTHTHKIKCIRVEVPKPWHPPLSRGE